MTAPHIVDPAGLLGQALADASPDLMRELLQTMINALLSADADSVCGAEWNARSAERTNRRNGYRHRPLDTRVGTVDVAVPKLRSGSYFPEWLLERRKRAESALITVVADCYLAGVSTRRMDRLVKTLGIDSLSKSQVSRMAEHLDEQVAAFRHRRLDEAGPFTFVTADALTIKVRENNQVVKAAVLLATGVNGDGHREVLGMQVATSETKASWNTFFADLVACGLGGTAALVNELVEAADDKQLSRVVGRYARLDLLCLDEVGYVHLDPRGAELLFQIITAREERASIACASNAPFSEWGTTFTDPRLAAAVVDRLTYNAHIIQTGTASYRLATTAAQHRKEPATT